MDVKLLLLCSMLKSWSVSLSVLRSYQTIFPSEEERDCSLSTGLGAHGNVRLFQKALRGREAIAYVVVEAAVWTKMSTTSCMGIPKIYRGMYVIMFWLSRIHQR